MMKTYTRLLGFARPLSRYTVPYFFYSVLHAVFNTFTYTMIIPIVGTLFSEGYGRYDLYGGDASILFHSLRQLRELPQTLTIYPGHGDAARLGDALDLIIY